YLASPAHPANIIFWTAVAPVGPQRAASRSAGGPSSPLGVVNHGASALTALVVGMKHPVTLVPSAPPLHGPHKHGGSRAHTVQEKGFRGPGRHDPGRALPLPRWLSGKRDNPAVLESEEHTSELQSREKLVCRLLLEKKNTTKKNNQQHRRMFDLE